MNRQLGIELLRIICMLFIIVFHISDHGTILINDGMPITLNWMALALAHQGGAIGNCAFVIIGGYFLCKKEFDSRRIIKLWIQTLFYSVVCGLIAFTLGLWNVTAEHIRSMLLPITYNEYWFISSYVVLLLFTPFINVLLNNLNKIQHGTLVGLGLLIFNIIPSITNRFWMDSGNHILLFITLYALGAYIRMYDVQGGRRYGVYAVVLIILGTLSIPALAWINHTLGTKLDIFRFAFPTQRLPGSFTALCLFLACKDVSLPYGKLIRFFSASVFSVYLIHIGRLRIGIFKQLFDDAYVYTQWYFPLWMIGVTITIFIVCVLIDQLRIRFIERPMESSVKALSVRCNRWLKSKGII